MESVYRKFPETPLMRSIRVEDAVRDEVSKRFPQLNANAFAQDWFARIERHARKTTEIVALWFPEIQRVLALEI